jgi:hypothetical protein
VFFSIMPQFNPSLVELRGVHLCPKKSNTAALAGWKLEHAWASAALLLAAEAHVSNHPLRTSLWDLQPLVCGYNGV